MDANSFTVKKKDRKKENHAKKAAAYVCLRGTQKNTTSQLQDIVGLSVQSQVERVVNDVSQNDIEPFVYETKFRRSV